MIANTGKYSCDELNTLSMKPLFGSLNAGRNMTKKWPETFCRFLPFWLSQNFLFRQPLEAVTKAFPIRGIYFGSVMMIAAVRCGWNRRRFASSSGRSVEPSEEHPERSAPAL